MTEEIDDLGQLFVDLFYWLEKRKAKRGEVEELSKRKLIILEMLHRSSQPIEFCVLRECFKGVSDSTVSGTLNELWREGFIKKELAKDQRSRMIRLTESGRNKLDEYHKKEHDRLTAMFEMIQLNEEERVACTELVRRLVRCHEQLEANRK